MGVTIRDVARLAGVSVTSTSAALNGSTSRTIRVSRETRERIVAAAAQLGYVGNPIAKSLATGRTKTIGVMLPYADAFVDDNPFCAEVMSGIMAEAVERHYNVMLYTATEGLATDRVATLVDSRIEGLLLIMPPRDGAIVIRCRKRGIPYVSVLAEPSEGETTVNSDDFGGAMAATRHLIAAGHRRIAHPYGPEDVATSRPRRRGFRAAMKEAGLPIAPGYSFETDLNHRGGAEALERLLALPEPPTAVFCPNDLVAGGMLPAARAAGLRIPRDLAIVGYDDTRYAERTDPPLTSVHMPIREMGALAADLLFARLEGRYVEDLQPVLPVSLTVRRSCGAPTTSFADPSAILSLAPAPAFLATTGTPTPRS